MKIFKSRDNTIIKSIKRELLRLLIFVLPYLFVALSTTLFAEKEGESYLLIHKGGGE